MCGISPGGRTLRRAQGRRAVSGRLLAANQGDRGFTAFALAGVCSMVFIGVAALRAARQTPRGAADQHLVAGH
ncbi:hypothetical protein SUDANB105_00960 [Streptomyces sp. enrichment culture]|uniref:hypothetical protein n=1 Tax=Streptomyces sp. enrichment culture TaxID=1795815 RepID=UPI003F563833